MAMLQTLDQQSIPIIQDMPVHFQNTNAMEQQGGDINTNSKRSVKIQNLPGPASRRLTPYPHETRFAARTPSPLSPSTPLAHAQVRSAPSPRTARPMFAKDVRTPRASLQFERGLPADFVMTRLDNIEFDDDLDVSHPTLFPSSSFPPTKPPSSVKKSQGRSVKALEINVPPPSPRREHTREHKSSQSSTPILSGYRHPYLISTATRGFGVVPRRSPAVDLFLFQRPVARNSVDGCTGASGFWRGPKGHATR